MHGRIPSKWETENVRVEDITESDFKKIEEIHGEANSYFKKLGRNDAINPIEIIKTGILPKGVSRESYRIQAIWLEQKIIGFLEYYEGFPESDILFIASLYFCMDYQKCGFGQQVIKKFSEVAKELKYAKIRLNVYLKNWPAIRFWTKQGFNTIWKIYGDKTYSEETFASMEIEKSP